MQKKIIVIPDSFKGSMSSETVAEIISNSIRENTDYEPISLPIADGGEGSTKCLINALGGTFQTVLVHSPEYKELNAFYGVTKENVAIIEIAESSGITKQEGLHALTATTYGFGELILDALENGIRKFLLCLGGSATTDAACGMAAALGVRFLDCEGNEFVPTGGTLCKVDTIDITRLDARVSESTFTVMSDVENPLYGPNGAAYVYGPQKGATAKDVLLLEDGLRHVANTMVQAGLTEPDNIKGAGAAGGAGYGCVAFLNAKIESGIHSMLNLFKYDELIKDASYIITGEGKLDDQSLMGKVVGGILNRSQNIPMIVFCGISQLPKDALPLNMNVIELGKDIPLQESIANGPSILKDKANDYFVNCFEQKI